MFSTRRVVVGSLLLLAFPAVVVIFLDGGSSDSPELPPSPEMETPPAPDVQLQRGRERPREPEIPGPAHPRREPPDVHVEKPAGRQSARKVHAARDVASLSGAVLDPWGRGIDGVGVWIKNRSGSGYTSSTETDDLGKFSFAGVPAGRYRVEAVSSPTVGGRFFAVDYDVPSFGRRVPTFIPIVSKDVRLAETSVDLAGDTNTILRFDAHSSLWGVVESATSGASIEAVSPEVIGAHTRRRAQWTSDSRGRFVLVWNGPGRSRHAVRVKARRSWPETGKAGPHLLDFAPSEPLRLDERAPKHVRRVFRLGMGGTLIGEVAYTNGTLPSRCAAVARESRSGAEIGRTWSRGSSTFFLKGLSDVERMNVHVHADECGVGFLRGLRVAPGTIVRKRVSVANGRRIQVIAYVDDALTNQYRAVLRRADRREQLVLEMRPRRVVKKERISSLVIRVPIGPWEIRVLDAGGRIVGMRAMTINPGPPDPEKLLFITFDDR